MDCIYYDSTCSCVVDRRRSASTAYARTTTTTGLPLLGGCESIWLLPMVMVVVLGLLLQYTFAGNGASAERVQLPPSLRSRWLLSPLRSCIVSSHQSVQYFTPLHVLRGAVFAYPHSPGCRTPETALECAGCPPTAPPGLLSTPTVQSHAY
jgi:hypothetical protein